MHQWYAGLSAVIAVLLTGCGSSTETQEAETPPSQAPIVKQTVPKIEFETKIDTVALEQSRLDSMRPPQMRGVEVRYMVQIGAFKDAHHASIVQSAARERYHVPALNDYNTASSLYQIRLGFFETREAAAAFRQRLQKDYPHDYRDAWVVQLNR